MKGYKAFKKGMICNGKQYAENTVFEEDEAKICEIGMHFCKKPIDVLDFYPLVDENGDFSEFAEVEALEPALTDDNQKFVTKKLKIGAKLSFADFIKSSEKLAFIKSKKSGKNQEKCDFAKIGSSGYGAVIMCAGQNSGAKAKKGSWITLAEWTYNKEKRLRYSYLRKNRVRRRRKDKRGYFLHFKKWRICRG